MSGKNKKVVLGAVVAVLVVGGGFYFSQGSDDAMDSSTVETAAGGSAATSDVVPDSFEGFVVKEGNPVVATVDGKEITRVDVYRFIQTMPNHMQQKPAHLVYPVALKQVINTRIVQSRADAANIEGSAEVKRELAMATQQIVRNVYLQQQVDKKVNNKTLKESYEDYIKDIKDVEERNARHILLKTESKAKAVIEKLKTGESFAALAASLSTGPTAGKGGDLGYFRKEEMVPEFANAAFALKKGEVVTAPVKTQFGWHVIKIEDIRMRAKPSLEEMMPLLKADLRQGALAGLLEKWRKGVKIETFDINGDPLKEGANSTGLVYPRK